MVQTPKPSGILIYLPMYVMMPRLSGLTSSVTNFTGMHRSRHNPKILWIDDAEIVGDRIT
jgi:hypothetical protein